jgi:beta-aspartyl-peptidase (threonine type)
VGAVARDRRGHLAAATSTGGLTAKTRGRVGDSPIIGAGTYARDGACAVSATGSGEHFIRLGIAHEMSALVRHGGLSLQAAADALIGDQLTGLGGEGGLIAVGADGEVAWSFNTPVMFRACAQAGHPPRVAIFASES